MRQNIRGSFDGVIVNDKSISKFLRKKQNENDEKKKPLRKEPKKYESQKALLNLKDIIFVKEKENRSSEIIKKKTENDNSKILAFGNRKVTFKIKNQDICLPPMKFIGNF